MSQQVDAIFDHGVFRPLVPLVLRDQARVKLTVEAEPGPALEPCKIDSPEVLARQNAALKALRREIDRLPKHRNNDGWSVRQHDEILYRSHK